MGSSCGRTKRFLTTDVVHAWDWRFESVEKLDTIQRTDIGKVENGPE